MTLGVNWHNVISISPQTLGEPLNLSTTQAGNIGWIGAASSNGGTITVGFNANVTQPINGVANATDGWPLAAGQTLPFLTGEGEPVGSAIYALATAMDQDVFVIGYAPDQGATAVTSTAAGFLQLTDGTYLQLTDGTNLLLVP